MNEEWRPVVGYEGEYEVSSLGRVRSLDRVIDVKAGGQKPAYKCFVKGRMLKFQYQRDKKYAVIMMRRKSGVGWKQRRVLVHSLVAAAFIGPRPPGYEVAHTDGVRANNRADNLRYATHRENESDKERHGTIRRGETHPQAKLTKEQVREIRLLAPYDDFGLLASHYKVTRSLISSIVTNSCWHDPAYTPKQRRVVV